MDSKPLKARIVISYILDYVILVAFVVGFFILDRVEPYHQHFALQNYTLQYPYAETERVSIGFAIILSAGIPAVTIIVYTLVIDGLFSHNKPTASGGRPKLFGKYTITDRLWELNCGILGLFLAQGAAFVITGALKNACGKPRPDLIDRCRPVEGSHDPPVFGLSDSSICTQTDHAILKDGFRSFPSGHSSSSFAGLFFMSLYLAGKLHLMDNKGEVWKAFIVMIPTLGAGLIAMTRIMDARHHPFDVISGSLLGILCAYVAYRQYFPPLSEPWKKGRAYPIRSWGSTPRPPRADRSEYDEINDGAHPLHRSDSEYMMSTGVQSTRPFGAKIPGQAMSPPPENPFEPSGSIRRRPDFDGTHYSHSSSSGASGPCAYEMQPGFAGRMRSESTTHLDPRLHADTEYRSQSADLGSHPASPPLVERSPSPGGPLRNT